MTKARPDLIWLDGPFNKCATMGQCHKIYHKSAPSESGWMWYNFFRSQLYANFLKKK